MTLPSAETGAGFLLATAARVSLLLLAAGIAAGFCGRAPAALRHWIWTLALGGSVLMPALHLVLPPWHAGLLEPSRLSTRSAPVSVAPPRARSAPGAPLARAPLDLPAATATPEKTFPVGAAVLLLWAAGAAAVALRLGVQVRELRQLDRSARRLDPATATALLGEDGSALRGVRLLEADTAAPARMPMAWGWRRPAILLPPEWRNWGLERLRVVLLHELAHLRRGDWAALWVGHAACVLYWFDPLCWWAARRLRFESELACDDRVLDAGISPADYAECLLEVIRTMSARQTAAPLALPMAHGAALTARMRAILDPQRRRGTAHPLALSVLAAAGALALFPLAALRPGDAPRRAADPPRPVSQATPVDPASGADRVPAPERPARSTGPTDRLPERDRRDPVSGVGAADVARLEPAGVRPAPRPAEDPATLARVRRAEMMAEEAARDKADLFDRLHTLERRMQELGQRRTDQEDRVSELLIERLEKRLAEVEEQIVVQSVSFGAEHPALKTQVMLRDALRQRLDEERQKQLVRRERDQKELDEGARRLREEIAEARARAENAAREREKALAELSQARDVAALQAAEAAAVRNEMRAAMAERDAQMRALRNENARRSSSSEEVQLLRQQVAALQAQIAALQAQLQAGKKR